jgi:hypothetical protein
MARRVALSGRNRVTGKRGKGEPRNGGEEQEAGAGAGAGAGGRKQEQVAGLSGAVSFIISHLPFPISHWSLVIGHLPLVICQWPFAIGHFLFPISCRLVALHSCDFVALYSCDFVDRSFL